MIPTTPPQPHTDEFTQPQVVQTSISDKTLKELGEMIANTVLEVQRMQQQAQVEQAKQEVEQTRLDNQMKTEQLRADERLTLKLVAWDTLFKGFVLLLTLGSIALIILANTTALLAIIVPVLTFVLGSVFNNPTADILKIPSKKKGQHDLKNGE